MVCFHEEATFVAKDLGFNKVEAGKREWLEVHFLSFLVFCLRVNFW